MTSKVLRGDCRAVMRTLEPDSVDAIVTDPPYHLTSGNISFDHNSLGPHGPTRKGYSPTNKNGRGHKTGFMGQTWDGGGVAFEPETWAEALRVLKPGGHLLAFSGSRTYHRMVCAIEDAGFEVRDQIMWVYGSGFPKSHDVSKGIDKTRGETDRDLEFCTFMRSSNLTRSATSRILQELGLISPNGTMAGHFFAVSKSGQPAVATREIFEALRPHLGIPVPARIDEIVDRAEAERAVIAQQRQGKLAVAPGQDNDRSATILDITAPATDAAREWEGWGTALKPAHEPIVLARKPLSEKTVAANVLRWGTGAINVDGCRVGTEKTVTLSGPGKFTKNAYANGNGWDAPISGKIEHAVAGRWPANLLHDGSDEVLAAFPESGGGNWSGRQNGAAIWGGGQDGYRGEKREADSGSASRFFKSCPWADGETSESGATKTASTGTPIIEHTEPVSRIHYCAKASKKDRDAGLSELDLPGGTVRAEGGAQHTKGVALARNSHPTVKPTALMRYLCRLVTPPGGTVLDPFTGSGSTGRGAALEGFDFVGIEQDEAYAKIARLRIADAQREARREAKTPKQLTLRNAA